jgi:hypothetical protein
MTKRVTWTSYPSKAIWGYSMAKVSYFTLLNVRQWVKEGYGIDDIAALTEFPRDYVKEMLIKWELWPDGYTQTA